MLARSMKVRNPLVDPLNVMQAELLKRLRKLEQDEADGHEKGRAAKDGQAAHDVARRGGGRGGAAGPRGRAPGTINGISQGMKNSG